MEDMIHGIKIQGSSDFVLRTREAFEKLTAVLRRNTTVHSRH